jgi:hypothetical protein
LFLRNVSGCPLDLARGRRGNGGTGSNADAGTRGDEDAGDEPVIPDTAGL